MFCLFIEKSFANQLLNIDANTRMNLFSQIIYYLVQNKSPVVFVIFHPNGEENPRKTGDR